MLEWRCTKLLASAIADSFLAQLVYPKVDEILVAPIAPDQPQPTPTAIHAALSVLVHQHDEDAGSKCTRVPHLVCNVYWATPRFHFGALPASTALLAGRSMDPINWRRVPPNVYQIDREDSGCIKHDLIQLGLSQSVTPTGLQVLL